MKIIAYGRFRIKRFLIRTLIIIGVYKLIYFSNQFFNNDKSLESHFIQSSRTFNLIGCDCNRTLYEFNVIEDDFEKTTCSWSAFQRGRGQKVVAYVFFGSLKTRRGYFEGIEKNLNLMTNFYHDWNFRLYFNSQDKNVKNKLCKIACKNNRIDLCDASNLPGNPRIDATKIGKMNWRFFPVLDPQVDYLASRDLDSIITQREVDAVKEWFQIGGSFHIMRDFPTHSIPMLGGMWSTNLTWKNVRQQWLDKWKTFLLSTKESSKSSYGTDQSFLAKYIWPWAQIDAVQHDSYHCNEYPNSKPFPTQRSNGSFNFVGANNGASNGASTIETPCPIICRPKQHKNWIYC